MELPRDLASCLLDGVSLETGLDREGRLKPTAHSLHSRHLFSSYHMQTLSSVLCVQYPI